MTHHVTKQGIHYVFPAATGGVIECDVRKTGEFNPSKMTVYRLLIARYYPEAKGTLLDIGANVGTTCFPLMLQNSFFTDCLAIEACPDVFECLVEGIRFNKLDTQIMAVGVAAGAKDGECIMYRNNLDMGDNRVKQPHDNPERSKNKAVARGWSESPVAMRSVDSLLREYNIFDVGGVWMDVQGYEPEVLKGAMQLLATRPPLQMEVCPYMMSSRGQLAGILATYYTAFVEIDKIDVEEFRRDRLNYPLPTRPVAEFAKLITEVADYTDVFLIS